MGLWSGGPWGLQHGVLSKLRAPRGRTGTLMYYIYLGSEMKMIKISMTEFIIWDYLGIFLKGGPLPRHASLGTPRLKIIVL